MTKMALTRSQKLEVGIVEFELTVWGDGTIRLYAENTITGGDIVIVLEEDGGHLVTAINADGTEIRTPIDLVAYLRTTAQLNNVALLPED